MKKLLITIFITATTLLFYFPAKAVQISPNSGTYGVGAATIITITAHFPEGAPTTLDGVSVYLSLTGGTVTGFTPSNDGNLLSTATCPGGGHFTSSSVCLDIATNSGYLTDSEVLGTFTVQWGSAGTGTITKTADNMYLDSVNQNEYPDAGVIGSFNISTGATPTLTPTATATATVAPTTSRTPETGISDGGGAIIIGLFVMLFGGILYKYSNNNYSIKHE